MKTFIIGIALIFLSCFIFANIIYVDDSNISGIEDGTIEYPFNTVEEGLTAAAAGDTVFIFTGLYNPPGAELLLKDGVIVQGEDSSSVIINSDFIYNEASANQPIGIYSLKCSAIYFRMGDGTAAITVSENRLDSIALQCGGGYTFIIINNKISKGIRDASGSNWTTISDNLILNGRIHDASLGTGETEFIENNVINFIATGEPDEDIVLETKSASVTIRNNIINCTGPASGIKLKSGPPTNVIGNDITINNGVPLEGTFGIYNYAGNGIVTENYIHGGYVGYYSASGATLFENNIISGSHTGFISKGGEEVKNNTITNCSGDGMILKGLRGPISSNIIKDNDSAGIRLFYPVDIGGGNFNGEGNNIIRNNGIYDLVIDYIPQQPETIYVMYNGWDHITLPEILQYDIFNEGGSPNIIINATGFYTDVEDEDPNISDFELEQNYPNPFNPSTNIGFRISDGGFVFLKVFDVLGNEVATLVDEYKPAGKYYVEFRIENLELSSGIYFYQLKAGSFIQTKKMILIK
jgi:hypothetical protein